MLNVLKCAVVGNSLLSGAAAIAVVGLIAVSAGQTIVTGDEATGTVKDGLPVTLNVQPVRSVLKAGEKQTTWIRVGLDGHRRESDAKRPPVNLSLVLDKSGSMQGEKIEQARKAAIDALQMLGPDDIVSVVTYDSGVQVVYPATRLTDREAVAAVIRSIQADGNTALFAGVSKGAAEVRKFLDKTRVNRIVLLSDGLANSGPSSPGELGDLGASLLKENISVSTMGLGLGYNEDLMVQLAAKSGGNHHFIEQATELADIFRREFSSVLSVVAQEIDLKVTIPDGIRPVRVLGNDADINGQLITTRMAQIYSEQKKHIVIEVELTGGEAGATRDLGSVHAKLTGIVAGKGTGNEPADVTAIPGELSGAVNVRFSSSDEEVNASLNKVVMADVVALVASEQNKLATRYLDEGKLEMTRELLRSNVRLLQENENLVPGDTRLGVYGRANSLQLKTLEGVNSRDDSRANAARKSGRAFQNSVDQQQISE